MDYYTMSSEILDSWDFIRFPVRAPNRDPHSEKSSIDDINPYVYYSKGVRKKRSRRTEPLRNRKRIESSTSLILTKTRSRKVVNEYFVSSFTSIKPHKPHNPVFGDFYDKYSEADNKPLIKVTVIPQGRQTQTENALNRKSPTRKPPSTTTNLDNSFNTKNVFLVVAGRKKEKIYELNTSCAGENHFGEKHVFRGTFSERMNNFKRKFTQKKDKPASGNNVSETWLHECPCPEEERCSRGTSPHRNSFKYKAAALSAKANAAEGFKESSSSKTDRTKLTTDVNAPKSRIRITGRLGLTEDNKYLLKCDATVDDKPISTQFQTAECCMFPMTTMLAGDERGRCPVNTCFRPPPTKQRDANIQADVRFFSCPAFKKVSQGTQVCFDEERQTPKVVANYDKIVQCCCTNTTENSNYTSDDEDITLKKCKSPIVIISVYPNQESSENSTNNKVSPAEHLRQEFLPQPVSSQKLKQKLKTGSKIEEANKKNKFAARSRSPSPLKSNNKVKDTAVKTNVYEKKVYETITASGSKKTKTKSSKVQTKKIEQKPKSPATSRSPSPSRRGNSPKPKPKATAGTNTEQTLTKKALVDDFTKKYNEQLNEKKAKAGAAFKTKHNVSNVSISIEGDSDYYNVSFNQGDLDTDLTVRRNNRGNIKLHGDDDNSTSLENFLFMPPENEPRKRSFSQTLMFDGLQTDLPTLQKNSKLNVRDSIEVSHRREDRASIIGKVAQTNSDKNAAKEVDTKFLGNSGAGLSDMTPSKHFQGDECSIMDPNERDREIRGLLGIDKGRFKPPAKNYIEAWKLYGYESEQVSLHCLYRGPSQSEAKNLSHENHFNFVENKLPFWQYTPEKKTPLHPNLDLNGHIEMLLQQEKLNKKKPIVLTRRQYAKVRKSIYNTLLSKNSMQRSSKLCTLSSIVSVGQFRKKVKEHPVYHYDKETQTIEIKTSCTINQTQFEKHQDEFRMKFNDREEKSTNVITKHGKDKSVQGIVKANKSITINSVYKTINTKQLGPGLSLTRVTNSEKLNDSIKEHHETMILFNATRQKTSKTTSFKKAPRKATSSLEIHNDSFVYQKQVKFSSSDIRRSQYLKHSISHNLDQKESHSIHTIFNGHRKSVTPNLGTSAYSLCPEGDTNHSDLRFSIFKEPSNCDLKPRKPFLKRLISCLVMRVSKNSDIKFPPAVYRKPSVYSSIDSYHINTSLGGREMSSSLYDTTASCYSNHTIQPITKMKRGFFSSVRGFLNRKS